MVTPPQFPHSQSGETTGLLLAPQKGKTEFESQYCVGLKSVKHDPATGGVAVGWGSSLRRAFQNLALWLSGWDLGQLSQSSVAEALLSTSAF